MPKKRREIKVLIALSGGVDSSVAAALLVTAGYDVTAAYMINYDDKEQRTKNKEQTNASCWIPDYRDAVRVAAKLNIPILKLNFTKEYKRDVLDYMFHEYKAGRTPNPDVLCNKFIKFGAWLNAARQLGFDFLATGHYSCLKKLTINKKQLTMRKGTSRDLLSAHCSLLISKDDNKDQTYFLHQLTQQQLQHVMFPIGEYTKPQVRQLAKKFDLPTAEKEESMGICFVGEVPMKEFLETKIKTKIGNVILSDGTILGQHDGLAFYTIGQRHGVKSQKSIKSVKSNDSKPLYVVDKRIETNELVVGFEDDQLLYKREITVTDINWIAGRVPNFPLQCKVRLRHRQPLQPCEIKKQGNKEIVVKFTKPQRAVTPGQFAVFYNKNKCLGGGVIQ